MEEIRPEVHLQSHDVNVRAITRYGIALVLGCIVTIFGLMVLFNYYLKEVPAGQQTLRLAPPPRLQPSPPRELEEMRAAEDLVLKGYAWVNPDQGVVRIPIERAMELLIQQNPRSRPQTAQPVANPVTIPNESGMGPILQQPGGPLRKPLGK
jgi:hypothetical protein